MARSGFAFKKGDLMNRREFVKALAGIPLVGLLAKLPKAEEHESYELSIGVSDEQNYIISSYGDSSQDWIYIGDSEPYGRYWNAQDSSAPVLRY